MTDDIHRGDNCRRSSFIHCLKRATAREVSWPFLFSDDNMRKEGDMNTGIRPLTSDDYEILADIMNSVLPDYALTGGQLRHDDEHRDKRCRCQRWLYEIDGDTVGIGVFQNLAYMFHPRIFRIDISVRPEYQRRGIGSRLYDHVLSALAEHDPLEVTAYFREDMTESRRFCTKRGFEEKMRDWEVRLDVNSFDPNDYTELEQKLEREGIRVVSYADLADDPDRDHKLWRLDCVLGYDVPMPGEYTEPTFEFYKSRNMDNPMYTPEAHTIAVCGDEFVGMNILWKSDDREDLVYTGLTGVAREFRRKGVALAMKVRGLRWCRGNGINEVRTWNATQNEGMLAINERLGFVKQPAWIEYSKTLTTE